MNRLGFLSAAVGAVAASLAAIFGRKPALAKLENKYGELECRAPWHSTDCFMGNAPCSDSRSQSTSTFAVSYTDDVPSVVAHYSQHKHAGIVS